MISIDRLRSLPKVELHVHLDGSVKPETVIELARNSGASLPAWEPDQLLPYMGVEGQCESLDEYLGKFMFVGQFLHTAEALDRVAFELIAQASEQNCRYVEIRFAPQLHRQEGLTVDSVIGHVLQGLKRGEETFGVKARCIVICLRGHSDAMNQEAIEAAARLRDQGVAAVDLAGAEGSYPPEDYIPLFELARQLNLPITIHAGEAAGASSVETAVLKLGATRIGHGVRAKEDPAVLELLRSRGIPLELCPISNLQTKAVSGWSQYPIREYFDLGVKVTVNTDNLTVSQTTLTREYAAICQHFNFTELELCQLVRHAASSAFLPEAEKAELEQLIERELEHWLNDEAVR